MFIWSLCTWIDWCFHQIVLLQKCIPHDRLGLELLYAHRHPVVLWPHMWMSNQLLHHLMMCPRYTVHMPFSEAFHPSLWSLYMYSIIPFFGCRYKSTLSGLVFLFCNPTIKDISYLFILSLSYPYKSKLPFNCVLCCSGFCSSMLTNLKYGNLSTYIHTITLLLQDWFGNHEVY